MQRNITALLAVVALGILAGCSALGPGIEDWPELAVHEHYVPHAEMRSRCAAFAAFGAPPMACAEINFAQRRCDIWFSAALPQSAYVRKHERLHCAGHDHEGESTLREALAGWRSRLSLATQAGEKQN
jgi:hypothetical protein